MSFSKAQLSLRAAILLSLLVTPRIVPLCASQVGLSTTGVAVGAQYDTTHVYVSQVDMDAFISSFTATFGGHSSKKSVTNVLTVPSSTEFQYVWTPVGNLSVFAFRTPIPFPFGQERTGYLVTDFNEAIKKARASGAEVIVEPFKDPVGLDAVIQWDGGVKTQVYWHSSAPSYDPLDSIPDNRVYLSRDRADQFVKQFTTFAEGSVVADERNADEGELGVTGQTYRRIRIVSRFGKMQVNVTDGHLPYPFGREVTGYEVKDLKTTLAKAEASGAKIRFGPFDAADRSTSIVEFPGGYLAEIHALKQQ